MLAREEPVEEERAHAADVEEAGRARGHADADAHRAYRTRAMLFGAHVSSSGGIDTAIDRIETIGGDCAQVFTQSPRMWRPTAHKPEAIERFKARRAEAGIGGVVCHALYLCNLAAPDDVIYEKSIATMCATVDAAVAIEADGVIFHVGSHLGAGFDAGLARVVAALEKILEHCDGDTWLLMENSAGTGDTIGRSIDELATLVDALGRHPRLGICLDSCHLYASGYDVTDPAVVTALVRRGRRHDRPRPASRTARQRQRDAARLEPRPPREHARGRDRRRPRRVPRATPSFSSCRRTSKSPGRRRSKGARRRPDPQAARAPAPGTAVVHE